MRKILDLTEMPPVYIPKRQHNLRYEFQEMTLTLYHHINYMISDGCNSVTYRFLNPMCTCARVTTHTYANTSSF